MEVHRSVHGTTWEQLQLCSGDLREEVGRVEVSVFFCSFLLEYSGRGSGNGRQSSLAAQDLGILTD